jgi:hypothetical protein
MITWNHAKKLERIRYMYMDRENCSSATAAYNTLERKTKITINLFL